jgi:hypothetical protein
MDCGTTGTAVLGQQELNEWAAGDYIMWSQLYSGGTCEQAGALIGSRMTSFTLPLPAAK